MIRAGMAQSAESPLSAETVLREGQIPTGPLFAEPMRVETVRPSGSDTWVACLVGLRSEQFRRVTLTSGDLSSPTIADTALSDEKFLVLEGGDLRDQFGVNQWLEQRQIITSLDLAKRTDILPGLRQAHWDLVIVDEAHRMSARDERHKSQRYRLGELLRDSADHVLLLTATPHKGDPQNFTLFPQLLELDAYADVTSIREAMARRRAPFYLRRTKEAMVYFPERQGDGTWAAQPVFTRRIPRTADFAIDGPEFDLYQRVTRFVKRQSARAAAAGDDPRARAVGFLMSLYQRRLAKLQEIRDALDDDAVFNVVGEVLPAAHVERVLRDYYAGRLGDADLEDRFLKDVDEGHFRAICQTALEGLGATGSILLTPNERRVAEDRPDCYLAVRGDELREHPYPSAAGAGPGQAPVARGHQGRALLPERGCAEAADGGSGPRRALRRAGRAVKKSIAESGALDDRYRSVFGDVFEIIDATRRAAASSVNAVMTAAHWLTGRHIVELEQEGVVKAEYGTALVGRLSADLKRRLGRGFSRPNLWQMRLFCLSYPPEQILQTPSGESNQFPSPTIRQTPSGKSANPPKRNLPQVSTGQPVDPTILQTPSAESSLASIPPHFPLPWSAYVRLLSVKNERAREFYETEAFGPYRKIRWQ